jgi:hypothetical protein
MLMAAVAAAVGFTTLGAAPAHAAAAKVTVDEECGAGWTTRLIVVAADGHTYRVCTTP